VKNFIGSCFWSGASFHPRPLLLTHFGHCCTLFFIMKYNPAVTSSRRKQRKAHFSAPSHERRKRMAAPLAKELKSRYNVRALPIRKDDEVQVVRGTFKGREGKVIRVYRKKWMIYIDKITRDKANGQTVHVGIHPSKVQITKLKMDKNRKDLIARRAKAKTGGKYDEGKFTEATIQQPQQQPIQEGQTQTTQPQTGPTPMSTVD
jgi:large subunit ribosomal protein L26e